MATKLAKSNTLAENVATLVRRSEKVNEASTSKLSRTARLQVVLPEQSVERLEALKEETEAASYSEVIRRALRLYEGLLAETNEGATLLVQRSDGSLIEVPLRRAL